METFLNILLLDDDSTFADTQSKNLARKLQTRFGLSSESIHFQTAVNLDSVQKIIDAKSWDIVLCDLGWGDQNLEGIQILNNIKMAKPKIYTVLYTAQDPDDETISQALQWKLNFVDEIIPIASEDYFEKMLSSILHVFEQKRLDLLQNEDSDHVISILETFPLDSKKAKAICDKEKIGIYSWGQLFPECQLIATLNSDPSKELKQQVTQKLLELIDQIDSNVGSESVTIYGTRLLAKNKRKEFSQQIIQDLLDIRKKLQPHLSDSDQNFAADISISSQGVSLKLKTNPIDQKLKKYNELISNLNRFPNIENHDLLALDKTRFIEFIKVQYGGFPQMAEARGLDLNNIYRVNRKFKNSPFIVFKYDTIMEILGTLDSNKLKTMIQDLAAKERLIKQAMQKN